MPVELDPAFHLRQDAEGFILLAFYGGLLN